MGSPLRGRRNLQRLDANSRLDSPRRGSQILCRPGDLLAQAFGGMEGPVRVAQQLPCQQDNVCLTGADDGVSLSGIRDHADGASRDPGFAADLFGKFHLVTGAGRDLRILHQGSRGRINQVNPMLFQQFAQLGGFVGIPAPICPVCCRDTHPERPVFGPDLTNRVHNLDEDACAVLETAAVFVGSQIAEWGEELMQQVAMGRMDFYYIKAGLKRPARGIDEGLNDKADPCFI